MALLLCHLADSDRELERLGEVSKGEKADEMVDALFSLYRPVG